MNPAEAARVLDDNGRWHPGIGDPYAGAWVIVAGYAVAAVLSIRAVVTARTGQRRLELIDPGEATNQKVLKRLWLLIAVITVALGINKQLDLQSLLIQIVRDRAVDAGWYDNRRRYQLDFIVGVAVLGFIATAALALALRRVLTRAWPAVLGLGLLVSFVVIRASSFHEVDEVLGHVGVNSILELAGIGLIIASAMRWPETDRDQITAAASGCEPSAGG